MTTTIDPDTRQVMADALRTIERLRRRLAESRDAWLDEPIAIVGIGCRFPGGADSPEAYWQLLRDGVDATGEFPADRADARAVYDPDPETPGKAYTIRGAFLGRVDRFEPEVFGISPREALGMDPQQRIALEICWEALERAGYAPDTLDGSRTGVYFGLSTTDYVRLRQQVGDVRDVDAYQLVGEPSFLAGRISYVLGLRGPSKVVDTSCSSSLVAVHEACQALRLRECDLALAGGVNLLLAPYGFVLMSKFRALAADGRCKTFDASADGYARGEGAGAVVLKRLADAIGAGDHIIAVVRGSAVNHDGRSSGLTVPNPAAQRDVIEAALAQARVDPAHVDYVEAHGTGTALGDPIELRALEAVLGRHHQDAPLLVGSVKTNLGHLEPAAGVAGLVKVALAIAHGEVPPHLHLREPNPNVAWDRLHVSVPRTLLPWPDRGRPRIGAVSSFGASGTNAHAVLEAAPPIPPRLAQRRPYGLFLASARTDEALRELADRHARWLVDPDRPDLGDACFTSHVGRAAQARGLAVVASTVDELASRLARATPVALPPHRHRKVAWLFTGQGAQYAGMGSGLYAEPAFRDAFDRCTALFGPALCEVLSGDVAGIGDTRHTQPALFTVEYALAELWLSWGLRPAAVAGHSVGEIVAACVAGVLTLHDAAALVSTRARLMAELPAGGAMAALFCAEERAREAIAAYPDTVALAAVNGPGEVVISGVEADVLAVLALLARDRIRGRRLAVSHAFHSPLIRPMLDGFRAALTGVTVAEPQIPLLSTLTGTWFDAAEGSGYWVRHAAGTVRFADGVRTLHGAGFRTFVELGPQPILSALGARCVEDSTFVPSLRRGADDVRTILSALGAVCLRGARPDWNAFHAGEDVRRVPLPTTPWRGSSYWFREAASPPPAPSGVDVPGVGRRLPGAVPAYEVLVPDGGMGALVDIAIAAARDCLGGEWPRVEDVRLEGPLDGERAVQLIVAAADDGYATWEVLSQTPAEEAAGAPWQRHARGTLHRRPIPVRERAVGERAVGERAVRERAVREAAVGERPGWADVVEAAVAAVSGAAGGTATRCAALDGGGDLSRVRHVRAHEVDIVSTMDGGVVGTAELLAGDGTVVGHVRDLRVTPAIQAVEPWRDPAALLHELEWHELPAAPEADLTGLGVLLVGAAAVGAAMEAAVGDGADLADRLRRRGADVTVAAAPVTGAGPQSRPDPDAVDALLDGWCAATRRPAHVILLTGLDAPRPEHTDGWTLDEYAARADLTAIALVRALASRADCPGARVTLVTRGAVPAGGGGVTNPTAGTLWGLGRVLALEHPERWGGLVDIESAEDLVLGSTEDQLAVRGGRRFGARLVARPPVPGELRRRPPIRADGTYLVTGGFGGIGLALAEWLARAGAGRLVLLGRHSRPGAARRLERLGAAVEVVAADVTDEAAMAGVFAALEPRQLRGIVHAAGVSDPQLVRDVTPDAYRRVWRPKVVGAWLLHQLSQAAELDFFLGFSSIAATWGSQHLASYAAGNAFLDGLAQHRAAAGLPALSVAWGPWELASDLFGADVLAFLRATGLRPLSAPQCLALLGALLADDRAHRIVCAVDWTAFKPVMQARADRPMLATIQVAEAPAGADGPAPVVHDLTGYLRAALADVLGIAPGAIDAEADVFSHGLDSLMIMEIVGRCKRDLRVTVRAADFFARPTLAEWVGLLGGQAGEASGATDPAWIARDVALAGDIRPQGTLARAATGDVLLTGATGFVGAYLLRELLATTGARVHCLVRCAGEREGLDRVRANYERYLCWPECDDHRIVVVPGDLTERLPDQRFDAVYHNAAWVNFGHTYDQLRLANLGGTAEVLRLAGRHGARVHHVSTYGIWGVSAGKRTIHEDDDIAAAGRLVTGYVQTKWAAERLVQLARERGIPVDVYRPGRVLGDSRTGACLTTHFTTRVIKGCVQLGLAPDIDIDIEMTPVDYVAAALVHIGQNPPEPGGGTYHLVNPHKRPFRELVGAIERHGFTVPLVPVDEWWHALHDTYAERPNELHPVMGVVEEFVVGGEDAVDYDTTAATRALDGSGIACPPLDDRLLDTYLTWLVHSGYLGALHE